ncbi:hypothetical protein [Streptomyces sp. NBC_01589]|uniref:hypothetical protein n=1 Tax=unclassified Streptomyces TaxID=2593676 RepID=UPI00386BA341
MKNPVDPLNETAYDMTAYDADGHTFAGTGHFPAPVNAGRPVTTYSSLPPGAYSKTWVGATGYGHRAVMDALRAGRVWACHGDLISGLDVRVQEKGAPHRSQPMGGRLRVKRGSTVEVVVEIRLTETPNYAGLLPVLARVDLISGRITGTAADRDTMTAPDTRVVKSWEVDPGKGTLTLKQEMKAEESFYVRVRGTDGKRMAPGLLGTAVDPAGPAMDVPASADPWEDLWFYGNPVFVEVGDL